LISAAAQIVSAAAHLTRLPLLRKSEISRLAVIDDGMVAASNAYVNRPRSGVAVLHAGGGRGT